jgi:hypothetical protein
MEQWVMGNWLIGAGLRRGVGADGGGGRDMGRLGGSLEAVDLLAFNQFQLAPKVVEGPQVAGDINENDGQEREDDNHG